MRRLVLDQNYWSASEQAAVLEYCASDVEALVALLPKMAPTIDWTRALFRGRYMAAVARMERAGVPIDVRTHTRIVESWESIKQHLIQAIDRDYDVYEGNSFRQEKFRRAMIARGIPWPVLSTGALALDKDTFREQARRYPELDPLYELRVTLSELRLNNLVIGSDNRNRCLLSPFSSKTGRNQPSTNKFIFGPARWLLSLIKPPETTGIAYIDFTSQEIGIAAALSGDERMIKAYQSGDLYLSFAKDAGLAPSDATKS